MQLEVAVQVFLTVVGIFTPIAMLVQAGMLVYGLREREGAARTIARGSVFCQIFVYGGMMIYLLVVRF